MILEMKVPSPGESITEVEIAEWLVQEGDYVLCAISGKEISLQKLNYWNVDLQEAYFSPKEANERFKTLKK